MKCRLAVDLDHDRARFPRRANKRAYKRLVMGKEVRLHNAYVIKAERVEKDAGNMPPSSVPMMPIRW